MEERLERLERKAESCNIKVFSASPCYRNDCKEKRDESYYTKVPPTSFFIGTTTRKRQMYSNMLKCSSASCFLCISLLLNYSFAE